MRSRPSRVRGPVLKPPSALGWSPLQSFGRRSYELRLAGQPSPVNAGDGWQSPNLFEIPTIPTVARVWETRLGHRRTRLHFPRPCRSETASPDGTHGAQGFSECESSGHRTGLVCVDRVPGHPGASVCTTTDFPSEKRPVILPNQCRITRVEPPPDARSLLCHLPQPTSRDSRIEAGRSRCRQPGRRR